MGDGKLSIAGQYYDEASIAIMALEYPVIANVLVRILVGLSYVGFE